MSGLLTCVRAGGEEGPAPPGRRTAAGCGGVMGGGGSHGVALYIQMFQGEWTHFTAAQMGDRC